MAVGFGVLGLAPNVFWSMTMKEFEAAVRGRLGLRVGDGPPSRADLTAIMHKFPDVAEFRTKSI